MAEIVPCAFLQNAGATHTAELMRLTHSGMMGGVSAGGALSALSGINPHLGGRYWVHAQSTPDMTVQVDAGIIHIAGSQGADAGIYTCINDATVTLTVDAADASQDRLDIIYVQVEDSFYSGSTDTWSIKYLAGTPASSPSDPTPSGGNYFVLADIYVSAGATSIANSDIFDLRQYAVGLGGIRRVSGDINRPAVPLDGDIIWRPDNSNFEIYDGADWEPWQLPNAAAQFTAVNYSSGFQAWTDPIKFVQNGRWLDFVGTVQPTSGNLNFAGNSIIVATMPSGFAPVSSQRFAVAAGLASGSSGVLRCDFLTDGSIQLWNTSTQSPGWASLAGVKLYLDAIS